MNRNLTITLGLLVTGILLVTFLLSDDWGNEGPVPVLSRPESTAGETQALPELQDEEYAVPEILVSVEPFESDSLREARGRVMPQSYRLDLATFIGRVLEADGLPVEGMHITYAAGKPTNFMIPTDLFLEDLENLPDEISEPTLHLNGGSAVTDIDGNFRIADIEPRQMGLLLLDPGGPRAWPHLIMETPASGVETDLGDIILPATVTFKGVLEDEEGLPIAGARVRAGDIPAPVLALNIVSTAAEWRQGAAVLGRPDGQTEFVWKPPASLARLEKLLPIPTTYTDKEGAFLLNGVPVGFVTIVADRPESVALVHGPLGTGAAGSTRDLGVLHMYDGLSITGKVVDQTGQPVPGAEVMAGNPLPLSNNEFTLLKSGTVSDEEGKFSLPGFLPGQGVAVARDSSHEPFTVSEVFTTGSEEALIVLPAPQALMITVQNGEGDPVSGARFHGRSTPEDDAPFFILPPSNLTRKTEELEPGMYQIEDLTPTNWHVTVQSAGYADQTAEIDLSEGDQERAHLVTLFPAETLTVSVVRAGDESPVHWAKVDVFAKDDSWLRLMPEFPLSSIRTDEQGLAVFRRLAPGEHEVTVSHPALAITTAEVDLSEENTLQVALDFGGTITGLAVDNGMPPSVPILLVLSQQGRVSRVGDGQRKDNGGGMDSYMPRTTICRPDGSFSFDRVDPGNWKIEARDANTFVDLDMTNWWMSISQSPLATAEVEVLPGETTDIALILGSAYGDIETGYLSGRLTVNGLPGEGWRILTWGKLRRNSSVDQDGFFDLGMVAAGEVTLQIMAGERNNFFGGTVDWRPVNVEQGERAFVNLDLRTGSVSGRVVSDIDGRPIPGAYVTAAPEGDESRRWGQPNGMAGENGAFVIEPIAKGTYTLQTRADGYVSTRSDVIEIRELQKVMNVELRVRPAIRVSGSVTLAGIEENPAWMWVIAREENGAQDSTGVDSETGDFAFEGMSPGIWTFTLASEHGEDAFQTITREIIGEQDSLSLVFIINDEGELANPFGNEKG